MKTNTIFALICLMILANFTACTKFEAKGSQKVEAASKSWITHEAGDEVTFADSKGKTMKLTFNAPKSVFNKVNDCHNQGLKEICEIYEMEEYFVNAFNADKSVFFTLSVKKVSENQAFYDIFTATFTHQSDRGTLQFPAKKYLSGPNPESLPTDDVSFAPSLTLNGKVFGQVFSRKSQDNAIYFTKNQGIVAFTIANETWVKQ